MDVALGEVAFKFFAQFVTAEVVNVEGFVLESEDFMLVLLDGEARVDEEGGVLLFLAAGEGHEADQAGHHGTDGREAGLGRDVQINEILDEAGGLLFQFRSAVEVGVDGGDAVLQGFDLRFHAHFAGGNAGDAHLHTDELDARCVFDVVDESLDFSDGGLAYLLDAVVG